MNKKSIYGKNGILRGFLAVSAAVLLLSGCGKGEEEDAGGSAPETTQEDSLAQPIAVPEPEAEEPVEEEPEEEPEEVREGFYRSELTNEWIDESLREQRPIAVMVDNELTALPHFGTSQGDVVYEMMNSLMNDRVTRFMILVKDWEGLEQFGSVRSTRPTNIILAAEYNAILCHDGGPYHNDAYWRKSWAPDHVNGVFRRFSNGKATEFTEYVTADKLLDYIGEDKQISRTYTDYWGDHFTFSNKEFTLEDYHNSIPAESVDLSAAFKHNGTTLTYDAEQSVYVYNEYTTTSNKFGFEGTYYDALNDEPLTFENVILMYCNYASLDEHGYLVYDVMTQDKIPGYYLTNGLAIPIAWDRPGETEKTNYYNASTGEPLVLNTGKTYIALVPSTYWDDIVIE